MVLPVAGHLKLHYDLDPKEPDVPDQGVFLHVISTKALLNSLIRGPLLAPADAKLAALFNENRGRVVSEEKIIETLWGNDPEGGALTATRVIRIRIHRLRKAGLKILSYGNGSYGLGLPAMIRFTRSSYFYRVDR